MPAPCSLVQHMATEGRQRCSTWGNETLRMLLLSHNSLEQVWRGGLLQNFEARDQPAMIMASHDCILRHDIVRTPTYITFERHMRHGPKISRSYTP